MYVLDEMLFPFEVLVENYSEEDKIFQVISKINPKQFTGSKEQIIIDNSDLPAHEKAVKNSDTGASFGHRTASTGESEIFYGYKIHLAAVNTHLGPIPAAARVAPANCSDVEIAPVLMKEAYDFHRNVLGRNPLNYILDASCDAGFILTYAHFFDHNKNI